MMLQSQNMWNTEMNTLTDVNKLILTDLKISNFAIVGLPQLDHPKNSKTCSLIDISCFQMIYTFCFVLWLNRPCIAINYFVVIILSSCFVALCL